MDKQFKGFRLTDAAVFYLERLAEKLGLNMTGVVETALRYLAQKEDIAQYQDGSRELEPEGQE